MLTAVTRVESIYCSGNEVKSISTAARGSRRRANAIKHPQSSQNGRWHSPLMAIVLPSRMATRVIGTAGLVEAALPDLDSAEVEDDVAVAAIVKATL